MGSTGRIKWTAPTESETITFEERTLPRPEDISNDIVAEARKVATKEDRDWRRFRHGLITDDRLDEPPAHTGSTPTHMGKEA